MQIEQLQAYTVIEKQTIGDLNSVGYLLRHNKTGARVALLSNDDENKVFYIGFRRRTARAWRISWNIRCSAGRTNFR